MKPSITQVTDQQLDRERQLDRVAHEIRGSQRLTLSALAEACVRRGMTVGLEDLELLASNSNHLGDGFFVPLEVSDFIVDLLLPLKPKTLLDPCVISAAFPLRIAERIGAERFDAFAPSNETIELAKLIGTREIKFNQGEAFDRLENSYDAVVSCPPFGGWRRGQHVVQSYGENLNINDDYAHQALLKSCLVLNEGGVAIFVVGSSFFKSSDRPNSALAAMRKLGFDVDVAIELPPSTFRLTSISTHIVMVRRSSDENVFAGRLQTDDEARNRLIVNCHRRRPSGSLALGVSTPREGFHGFSTVELELKVRKLAREMQFEPFPFGEVFLECRQSRTGPNFIRFTEEANCVYLPAMANSPAATSQEQLSSRLRTYFKLAVNPMVADVDFVAELLNSPFGNTWRDSLKTGAVMSSIRRSQLENSTFYLPPKAIQRAVTACHREINNVAAELHDLQDRLWQRPQHVLDIQTQLRTVHRRNSFEDWIDSLPFPLASILWRCYTDGGSVHDQFRSKLQFFEACSQFIALVHLSAFSSDTAIWHGLAKQINGQLSEHYLWIEQATFGTWGVINQHLIAAARKLLNDNEGLCFELYRTSNRRLLGALTSASYLTIIQHSNSLRNKMQAHAGALGEDDARDLNEQLMQYIHEFKNTFGFLWEDYQLLLPGSNEYDSGIHKTEVQCLRGTRQPFPREVVDVIRPMQRGTLHLKSRELQQTLELLPLIKVMAPPRNEQQACYFFNRKEPGGLCFLSYHFRTESNIVEQFEDAALAINRLFHGY